VRRFAALPSGRSLGPQALAVHVRILKPVSANQLIPGPG
jgi:hypothetical protein